jgi:hypothetical protein
LAAEPLPIIHPSASVRVTAGDRRLIAMDQKVSYLIVGVGSQRFAFDLLTASHDFGCIWFLQGIGPLPGQLYDRANPVGPAWCDRSHGGDLAVASCQTADRVK